MTAYFDLLALSKSGSTSQSEIGSPYGRQWSVKVPMIVPPAAVKSPYYGNHLIRAMWRQAAEALRKADELVIMGFSLPPSDQIVSSLLATELNVQATVTPVDYGKAIVDHLKDVLGCDRQVVTEYAGRKDRAVPDWVRFRANLG
jgi:hypothetical protein